MKDKAILIILSIITLCGAIYFFLGVPQSVSASMVGGVQSTLESTFKNVLINTKEYMASVFFVPSITVSDLQTISTNADLGQTKIKVLIVPGHEPTFGGAEYKNIKERNLSVKIGKELNNFFSGNSRYDVQMTRDGTDWLPPFKDYFSANMGTIADWIHTHRSTMMSFIANGSVSRDNVITHNTAPNDVAYRLYMINKWVNENNIDIVLHLHINDNPRPNVNKPGDYNGFVVYVPEHQYSNAGAAKTVADNVYRRLAKYFPVSNLPAESDGVVEDQDLIAVGSNNTVDAVSMLVEYGYIYEPMFASPAMQDIVAREMAFQTYLGVQQFFGKGNDVTLTYDNVTLPYAWNTDFRQSKTGSLADQSPDIFALQMALAGQGYYPPAPLSKNDCPMTGILGPCTMKALKQFQKDHAITDEPYFGPKTRAAANVAFGVHNII